MSFFDEPFVDPTIVPRTADPRVTAWSTGEVQTAATHGYEQRAKQAQAAASGNPSGQGSRIVRPIQGTFKENSDARPPAWSPKETNVPETRRHAQSFASLASAQAPAKLFMKNTSSHEARSVLPHLRRQPEHWQMTPQSSKTDAKASIKGTAGQAAKSAKSDGPFPCTYDDCTRGFQKEREMLQHKADEHDYCPRCKLDFENDEALLEHKIDSEDHICCTVCGEDFMSEGGRDRHERQVSKSLDGHCYCSFRQSHNSRQNIKCVGCGFIFDRGAGLIDHIYYNKCSNKGGAQPGKVNEFTLRENRVYAALDLDRKSHRRSTIAAEIAQMQPSMRGFVAEYASTDDGGVGLLDSANPDADSMPGALLPGENEGDVTSTPAPDDPIDPNKWPTIGEGLAKGIDAMRIVSSNSTLPRVRGFKSRGIFLQEDALAKPMPKKGDWTAPTMPDYRTSFLPGQQGRELIVRTDWDFLIFERHGVDNMFHCPFIHCG